METKTKYCCHCKLMKDISEFRKMKKQCQYQTTCFSCEVKCRHRIKYFIKFPDYKMRDYVERQVGCSREKLIAWLDFTKDYYVPKDYTGKINIDHFFPIHFFNINTEEGLFKASHWTNLRLYPFDKNLKKGKSIPNKEEIIENNKLISLFLKFKK